MPVHDDAVDFLRLVSEADSQNRSRGLEDLKFCNGDQWPTYAIQSRGMERPQLTINETDAYCRQVENQQRQQRPRINVHATNLLADPKVAKVLKGVCRHIEVNSNGDNAYDTAFSYAIRIGWGYFRLYRDFIREDSFDQDIFIGAIDNPFTVYFDPNSTLLDGSDAEKVLVTDLMTKDAFRKAYPGAQESGFMARATGDSEVDWVGKNDIRIAEYYSVDQKKDTLVKLSDGTIAWKSQLPKPEVLQAVGITVVGDRPSYRKQIKWAKVSAFETLEEKDIPGRWIPIIPVYGRVATIDGKRQRWGLVRDAKDPAKMNNFWYTSITESIALAPKAKWLIPEGADEGYENEYAQANLSAKAALHYKTKGLMGEDIPPPERVQPEPPPEGAIAAMMQSSQALQRVLGIVDPAQKISGNVSGKALIGEQQKSDNSTFNYYDNLTTSIRHGGRIILSWCPVVYDTQRVLRMIGDDGQPSLVTVNERTQDEQGATKILNDLTVGDYDVVMDTGPGYNSKRQEALANFTDLLQNPELAKIIGPIGADLIVRLHDAPGMDVLADRLAASNPMAKIDENSEVPPKAQMLIKQLQDQVQKMQQAIQQLEMEKKYRSDLEGMKQDGETKRELMRTTAKAHDIEKRDETKRHDVDTRGTVSLKVEEIKGFVELLNTHLKHAHDMESAERQMDHETNMADRAVTAKENQKEPA